MFRTDFDLPLQTAVSDMAVATRGLELYAVGSSRDPEVAYCVLVLSERVYSCTCPAAEAGRTWGGRRRWSRLRWSADRARNGRRCRRGPGCGGRCHGYAAPFCGGFANSESRYAVGWPV